MTKEVPESQIPFQIISQFGRQDVLGNGNLQKVSVPRLPLWNGNPFCLKSLFDDVLKSVINIMKERGDSCDLEL